VAGGSAPQLRLEAQPDAPPVPEEGLTEAAALWANRSQVWAALAASNDGSELDWSAGAAAKRADRVGYAYAMHAIDSTRWPKGARVWRHALPAESIREMLVGAVPVPAVDWRLTRQRQSWPPQEFFSRVRRRHPASLLAGVLRYTLNGLARRREAVLALDKGALDAESPMIAASLVLLSEPPLEAVEAVLPTKQELRHVAREGWPWTALAVVAAEFRAQDRLRGIDLAKRLLLPDQALRGATFHLACYGEILLAAKQAGFQHRSVRPIGIGSGPVGALTNVSGRKFELWYDAGTLHKAYGGTDPYGRASAALTTSPLPMRPDIVIVDVATRCALGWECKHSYDPAYLASGLVEAHAYITQLGASLKRLPAAGLAVPAGAATVTTGPFRAGRVRVVGADQLRTDVANWLQVGSGPTV
jgi:hypothetical protein